MYGRSRKIAFAAATRHIGLNGRGLLQDDTLEYYSLWRQLLFERFKIQLRTVMLTILNIGLDRAGRELGFSVKLEVKGLPTLDTVTAAQRALATGEGTFKDIVEPFVGY